MTLPGQSDSRRDCGRPIFRKRFEVEVVYAEDGQGDDWSSAITDALSNCGAPIIYGVDMVEHVMLVASG
jgi:hypothetical protein